MPLRLYRALLRPWGGAPIPAMQTPAGRWNRREGLLLRLELSDGSMGLGEASPLPGFSSEGLGEARNALLAWGRAIERHRPSVDPDAPALREAGRLTHALLPWPSAVFAAQSALLDALARHRGLPLHRLLAPASAPPDALSDAAWLGTLRSEEVLPSLATHIESLIRDGARAFKLKLNVLPPPGQLASLLAALPPDTRIRLDLQGRLPEPGETRRWLLALNGDARIEAIEEPFPTDRWPTLPRTAPFPAVARDESMLRWPEPRRPTRLRDEITSGRCHGAILKPALLGGLLSAARLARTATQAGGAFTLTHLLDGPVARAAVAELALALRAPWSLGLSLHPASSAFPDVGRPAALATDFVVQPHEAPGIGLPLEAVWESGQFPLAHGGIDEGP